MNKEVNHFLDYIKNNPINVLDGYSIDEIKEYIEHLKKNGDVLMADGKSALAVLENELERREGGVK